MPLVREPFRMIDRRPRDRCTGNGRRQQNHKQRQKTPDAFGRDEAEHVDRIRHARTGLKASGDKCLLRSPSCPCFYSVAAPGSVTFRRQIYSSSRFRGVRHFKAGSLY